jgi:hypothetical protein
LERFVRRERLRRVHDYVFGGRPMPFKSQAQRRKFAELLVKGEISEETFEEWNWSTGSRKLPERVKPKKGGGRKKAAAARKKSAGRATRKKSTGQAARKKSGRKSARTQR